MWGTPSNLRNIIETWISSWRTKGALESTLQAVKNKTDNLPANPASASLGDLIKELREWNISYEFVAATQNDLTRNVQAGLLDHIIIGHKADDAPDWSGVTPRTVYLYYKALGDLNPQYVKEAP